MKKIILLFVSVVIFGCKSNNVNSLSLDGIDFRSEMRNFVIEISQYSKNINSDFIIIPQNGQGVGTTSGDSSGTIFPDYFNAIDAVGRESMFYGYYGNNEITPAEDRDFLLNLCSLYKSNNIEVLATDYCATKSKISNSFSLNSTNYFIPFVATERNLFNIPLYSIYHENNQDIKSIHDVKNFLYIINGDDYNTKVKFKEAVADTNYDLLIIDLFHNEEIFTAKDIADLKIKKSGGTRLVICYMSIGEAEDYRYYWQESWIRENPSWLESENSEWKGNYKVRYWNSDWQNIIYGNKESYLDKILTTGYDGVYLDIIDGYEFFEEQ